MNGRDASHYLYANNRAKDLGFILQINGDCFNLIRVYGKQEKLYGKFFEIQEVLNYLHGYDAGLSEGKVIGMKRSKKTKY